MKNMRFAEACTEILWILRHEMNEMLPEIPVLVLDRLVNCSAADYVSGFDKGKDTADMLDETLVLINALFYTYLLKSDADREKYTIELADTIDPTVINAALAFFRREIAEPGDITPEFEQDDRVDKRLSYYQRLAAEEDEE